jgi:hypothetical protein
LGLLLLPLLLLLLCSCAGELSAVDTTLLQAVRTLFVWIINLIVYAAAVALTPDRTDQGQLNNAAAATARPDTAAAAEAAAVAGPDTAAAAAATALEGVSSEVEQTTAAQLGRLQGAAAVIQHLDVPSEHQQQQQKQQKQQQQTSGQLGVGQAVLQQQQQQASQPVMQHGTQQQSVVASPNHTKSRGKEQRMPNGDSSSSSSRDGSQQPVQPQAYPLFAQQAGRGLLHALGSCCHGIALTGAASAAAAVAAAAAVGVADVPASAIAASAGALALPPLFGIAQAGSSTAAAAAAAVTSPGGVVYGLPGEPWLVWSFMQAAGFALLVIGEHDPLDSL